MKFFTAAMAVLFLVASAGTALAQADTEVKVKIPDTTFLEFEDTVIDGKLHRPDGTIIKVREPSKFSPMILIRASYVLEILGSTNDL